MRIKLKAESNPSRSDFINASPIVSDCWGPPCSRGSRSSLSAPLPPEHPLLLLLSHTPWLNDVQHDTPFQIEHDPRMPAYIATQGPLSHTIADFWQVSVSQHLGTGPCPVQLRSSYGPDGSQQLSHCTWAVTQQ